MFSTFLTVALFVAPAIRGVVADFAINSPDLVQCQNAQISWEPTAGPYNLIVVKASDPCGDALVEVGDFDKTSITWKANVKAGTQVQLSLVDAKEQEAWSKTITVGAGNDASCLPGADSGAGAPNGDKNGGIANLVGPSSNTPAPAALVPQTSASSIPSSSPTPINSADDSSSSAGVVVPVGAANAGTNPFSSTNAAFSVRQARTPLLALTGLIAAFALL